MTHDERSEKLVRRIEGFSDLVIGFSLALLGLTLKIPPNITDLVNDPWWLIAYAWTFAVIAALWFQHQRLFSHFFSPHPLTIVLNFLALATIGLIVYFVQVFVHYHTSFEKVWAAFAYFAALGTTLLSFGILYLHGTRIRWNALDPDLRYLGIRHALRGIISGMCMFAGVGISVMRQPKSLDDLLPLVVLAATGLLVARIATRLVKPGILGGEHA